MSNLYNTGEPDAPEDTWTANLGTILRNNPFLHLFFTPEGDVTAMPTTPHPSGPAAPSPSPRAKASDKTVNRLDLWVATSNIRKDMPGAAIEHDMRAVHNKHLERAVNGHQEIETSQSKAILTSVYGNDYGIAGLSHGTPIVWPHAIWNAERREDVFLHDGREHISPARYMSVVVLRAVHNPRIRIARMNTHMVSQAYNNKTDASETWRRQMWSDGYKKVCAAVARYESQGLPVIITGDTNRGAGFRVFGPSIQYDYQWGYDCIGHTRQRKSGMKIHVLGKEHLTESPGQLHTDHPTMFVHYRIEQ